MHQSQKSHLLEIALSLGSEISKRN